MRLLQVVSAFYLVALFVYTGAVLLAQLWNNPNASTTFRGITIVFAVAATLICAITTLGAS